MANLTATAELTRKLFAALGVVLVLAVIAFLLVTFSTPIRNALFPPKDVAVVAFGKLPPVNTSQGIKPPGGVNYTIETISGGLPTLPGIVKVFAIGTPLPSFGDINNLEKEIEGLGFDTQPISNYGGKASFYNKTNNSTITFDTASGNFSLTSDYLNNQKIIASSPDTKENSIKAARKLLDALKITKTDFPDTNIETVDYKIDGTKLSEALSTAAANLTQVNFVRADIDKHPVISPNFKSPNLWILVWKDGLAAGNNTNREIQKYKFSTYPLKGVEKAFDELNAGSGVYNKELKGTDFAIRSVDIGYIETGISQAFLEPFYLFHGDEGMIAYVPAVDSSWIQSPSPASSSSPGFSSF